MKYPLFFLSCLGLVMGCGAEGWHPQPPSGNTYQYDYQGFREKKTNVVGGVMAGPGMGMAMGGGFGNRKDSELHGQQEADPFAESSPIDGIRFNEHLAGQGTPVVAPGAPVSTGSAAMPSVAAPLPVPGGQI